LKKEKITIKKKKEKKRKKNENKNTIAEEVNCKDFKKFSVNYLKCKAELIKDKTISLSKNIVEDTKSYQKKEWSEGKKKANEIKKKY